MALYEVDFPSSNQRDTIHAWIYQPVRPARAVVHLIHGLGEHSRRYLPLITALLDAGFVVVADDHAGHGKTAAASGVWFDAGENAAAVVVDDEEALRAATRARYPDLPYIVFGHSWGSMIARGLAAASGEEVDGLILGGIAAQIAGLHGVVDRAALAAEPDQLAPADAYLGAVFAGFLDRYEHVNGPTDWVAADIDVVRDHGIDPFNNFGAPMTIRFLRGFIELYDMANGEEFYASLRSDLPVLILSGDGDPVTNFSEGAAHVAERLADTGHTDVVLRTYADVRHEVHNEPQTRDEVTAEIIGFVERVIG